MTAFDARPLARAWLAVTQAAATADDRPVLNRTVHVERYASGVRLTSTDSYLLLTAWVPTIDALFEAPPEFDEAPEAEAILADVDGLGAHLMKHLAKVTRDTKDMPYGDMMTVEARLRLSEYRPDTSPAQRLEGLSENFGVVEVPDVERVWLRRIEWEFPSWRSIEAGFEEKRTGAVVLNPEVIGRLCKAAGYLDPGPGSAHVLFRFGGPDKVAAVEITCPNDDGVEIKGLVMPVRSPLSVREPDPEPEPDAETPDETAPETAPA